MNNEIIITNQEKTKISQAIEHARLWANEHSVAIGVAEIALGAAAISYGINSGAIEYGKDIVATLSGNIERTVGLASTGVGALAGALIGGIGVAFWGTAIGIPAAVVIGGAAWVLGASGYTVSSEINKLLNPIDYGEFFAGVSVLSIGVALLVDGLRRITPDWVWDKARDMMCELRDNVICLGKSVGVVIAKTKEELCSVIAWINDHTTSTQKVALSTGAMAVGGVALATTVGTSIAASSVTVLGSHTLGSLALSVGLVSAPILPVVLCGIGGAVLIGGVAYKLSKIRSHEDEYQCLLKQLTTGSC